MVKINEQMNGLVSNTAKFNVSLLHVHVPSVKLSFSYRHGPHSLEMSLNFAGYLEKSLILKKSLKSA